MWCCTLEPQPPSCSLFEGSCFKTPRVSCALDAKSACMPEPQPPSCCLFERSCLGIFEGSCFKIPWASCALHAKEACTLEPQRPDALYLWRILCLGERFALFHLAFLRLLAASKQNHFYWWTGCVTSIDLSGIPGFGLSASCVSRLQFSQLAAHKQTVISAPNEITGANAGGRHQFWNRMLWAARIAQFCR